MPRCVCSIQVPPLTIERQRFMRYHLKSIFSLSRQERKERTNASLSQNAHAMLSSLGDDFRSLIITSWKKERIEIQKATMEFWLLGGWMDGWMDGKLRPSLLFQNVSEGLRVGIIA